MGSSNSTETHSGAHPALAAICSQTCLSCSLNSFKGGYIGHHNGGLYTALYRETIIRVMKWDTRSLGYGSFVGQKTRKRRCFGEI